MTTKGRDVTYSDHDFYYKNIKVGFAEDKSGKAKDRGPQKRRQEKVSEEQGLLRVYIPEGGPIRVTGEVDTRRPVIGGIPLWIPENGNESIPRQERKADGPKKN
jgi:hypothetical protein